jgi:pimeloyl-ACP methyl ester carboxylesterase
LWEHKPSAVLPVIDVPVLLIHAVHDGGQPHTEVTAPGVRVERLHGDHDLHVQQPEAIADLLLDFAS